MKRLLLAGSAALVLLSLAGCPKRVPIQLGSLNEPGTPGELLANLQARLERQKKGGALGRTVQSQQAIEELRVGTDEKTGLFVATNRSEYYMDQVSFACEVGSGRQYVFFSWDVGVVGGIPVERVEWLTPGAEHREFPSAANPTDHVVLLHNGGEPDENLRAGQVNWLIHKYKPHDCTVLDIAGGRPDRPEDLPAN